MTTIAWDGKTLAADRCADGWMTVGKIYDLGDGRLIAAAGYLDQLIEIVLWLQAGAPEEARPKLPEDDGSNVVLIDQGKAYFLTWPFLRPVAVREKFYAVGSGSDFALGAMAMGADAKKAVEIASRFDPYTGNGVDTVTPEVKRGRRSAR